MKVVRLILAVILPFALGACATDGSASGEDPAVDDDATDDDWSDDDSSDNDMDDNADDDADDDASDDDSVDDDTSDDDVSDDDTADDDVIDDDVVDDDSTDDDLSDDDTSDDDTTDDDTGDDDTGDDDTGDDDTDNDDTGDDDTQWPDACEDPAPEPDACSQTMWTLYCRFGFPVDDGSAAYSQEQAVDHCRDASEPMWTDILDCGEHLEVWEFTLGPYPLTILRFADFVRCLQDRNWPPTRPDVFSVFDWYPPGVLLSDEAAALNFWTYVNELQVYIEISGALLSAEGDPRLVAVVAGIMDQGGSGMYESGRAESASWDSDRIELSIEYRAVNFSGDQYFLSEGTAPMELVPVD